jgi:hypothetical protein
MAQQRIEVALGQRLRAVTRERVDDGLRESFHEQGDAFVIEPREAEGSLEWLISVAL